MQTIGQMVAEAMYARGVSQASTAARADVATSTIHRIRHGEVEPSISTVEEILAAIGLELVLGTRPLSDRSASTAARVMLEPGYQPTGHFDARWIGRLQRWAGHDPVALMTEAGRASALLDRPNVLGIAGRCTLGRLASAGQASSQQWAVSGAAALRLGQFAEDVAPLTILRCEDAVAIAQLLADGRGLRATKVPRAATVLLIGNDDDALIGRFEHEGVQYAAPVQIMLDSISLGGEPAARALDEIAAW